MRTSRVFRLSFATNPTPLFACPAPSTEGLNPQERSRPFVYQGLKRNRKVRDSLPFLGWLQCIEPPHPSSTSPVSEAFKIHSWRQVDASWKLLNDSKPIITAQQWPCYRWPGAVCCRWSLIPASAWLAWIQLHAGGRDGLCVVTWWIVFMLLYSCLRSTRSTFAEVYVHVLFASYLWACILSTCTQAPMLG